MTPEWKWQDPPLSPASIEGGGVPHRDPIIIRACETIARASIEGGGVPHRDPPPPTTLPINPKTASIEGGGVPHRDAVDITLPPSSTSRLQ